MVNETECGAEQPLRPDARDQPELPGGADAQGVRADNRSAASSELRRQLCAIRACRGDLSDEGSCREAAPDTLRRLIDATAATSNSIWTLTARCLGRLRRRRPLGFSTRLISRDGVSPLTACTRRIFGSGPSCLAQLTAHRGASHGSRAEHAIIVDVEA